MSDERRDAGDTTRPEVVEESVVVVTSAHSVPRYWGMLVAIGIVAMVFGVVVLANIWASIHLVAIFAGLFLLFVGVIELVVSGAGISRTSRVVTGALAIVAGIVLIVWPDASVKTVAVIVGLSFLVWGLMVVIFGISERGEGYGTFIGFGVVSAIIGLVFIVWPGPTVTLLMILVGLSAVVFGIASIAQGLALRRS